MQSDIDQDSIKINIKSWLHVFKSILEVCNIFSKLLRLAGAV